jgi:hypothetical protein
MGVRMHLGNTGLYVVTVYLCLGCGNEGRPTGPKAELDDYADQLIQIQAPSRESEIFGMLRSLSNSGMTNSSRLVIIGQMISLMEPFIADLQSIRIDGSELRAIHGKYVQGWQTYLRGFRLLELGVQNDDLSVGELAFGIIADGGALLDGYLTEILLYRAAMAG